MGRLTTHVLDTTNGVPARGITIKLYALEGERRLIQTAVTNSDGRTDHALLDNDHFATGSYEIVFHIGDHFKNYGLADTKPAFLDEVPVRFSITEDQHYHVPLLVSPWSYSTYRGS